ncbi:hypothetical protein BT63DRAFT_435380 [Microthyrium microscopicum]|uniref:GDSL lipase/acylhydrolase family protein n=1 Tax=Microthyrium microscopicum TaxID=703497 RepID=A0A6A6UTH5_9PEZI|nr:hypothetical protein BT63DRAFT_435380 [Microthyrium microscopicum]
MPSFTSVLALLGSASIAYGLPSARNNADPKADNPWASLKPKTVVYFGDSYTDGGRGVYFMSGSPVPPGWDESTSPFAKLGKKSWPDYVKQYSGTNSHNYAMSGASCSSVLVPRKAPIPNGPKMAGVQEDEIPGFMADKAFKKDGKDFLNDIDPASTVYTIWIGTNDLGAGGYLTDEQAPGKTVLDYVECVYSAFDKLYAAGGRKFILINNVPLDKTPLYTLPKGQGADQFYPTKPSDPTQLKAANTKVGGEVKTANDAFLAKTQKDVVTKRYPGADMVVYNVHKLFEDIISSPKDYLNGTEPPNVTGVPTFSLTNLLSGKGMSSDSYLWGDALHPSEQTDRLVAKEFVNVMTGKSKYAVY